jgi:photosystem P840 reaction center protein PscD
MSVWRTGNPVHKADKYFITDVERDQNGRVLLSLSSAGGYGKITNTPQVKELIKEGAINVFVLSSNENIAMNGEKLVRDSEERYVTDFDGRSVRCTMREMPVFVNPNNDRMSIEVNGRVYTLEEFFK